MLNRILDDAAPSPFCLECPVCSPGCPEVDGRLSGSQREAMRLARHRLLGQATAPAPRQCQHCAQAPCMETCPAGAMRRDPASGLVYVDRARCVGCWMCVLACPFGAVVPSAGGRHAAKCDGCLGQEAPACAGSCHPRDALFLPGVRMEAVHERRAGFAVAGWGCPGPISYPPPQANPRSIQPPPPDGDPRRYVIVGAGITAVQAAEALRAADPRGSIAIVSDEVTRPYSRVLLSHHVAGIKDERSLALRPEGWQDELGVEMVAGDGGAQRLDVERRLVILGSGRELPYDRLLIATGASSVRLRVPGADLAGVMGLRNLPDATAISAMAPHEAVVVGGGFVGIKAAEALHEVGVRVTIVEMLGHLLPQMLDLPAATMVREQLEARGVRVLTGVGVQAIEGNGRAAGVLLAGGERLRSDLVVVGVGVRANVGWLQGSPVQVERGVIVDGQMRTNVPNVWAGGDVAEGYDQLSGTRSVVAIWPVAAAQGRIAGANMAGGFERFAGAVPMNTLDVFGLAVASFGRVRGEDERVFDQGPGRYLKTVYRDGNLVGAVLVGELREAGRLLAEARRQCTATAERRAVTRG